MKRVVADYLERGGSKTAIAKAWGVSVAYVWKMIKANPTMMIEFTAMNPKRVHKAWVPGVTVRIPDKVFFDDQTTTES